jgi:hypothetical protein
VSFRDWFYSWINGEDATYGNRQDHQDSGSGAGASTPTTGSALVPVTAFGASAERAPRARLTPEPVAHEIIAYRAWLCYPGDDGRAVLGSLTRHLLWEGPTLVADVQPAEEHLHGIHAVKQPWREWASSWNYTFAVDGEVALSGVVLEGETGYRAERATIRALTLYYKECHWGKAPIEIARELEERYQVDVKLDGTAVATLSPVWPSALMVAPRLYAPPQQTNKLLGQAALGNNAIGSIFNLKII